MSFSFSFPYCSFFFPRFRLPSYLFIPFLFLCHSPFGSTFFTFSMQFLSPSQPSQLSFYPLPLPFSSLLQFHVSLLLLPFIVVVNSIFLLLPLPQKNKLSLDFLTSGSRHRLTKLNPATQYEVKVVVVVAAMRGGLNLTCVADGTGKERVHSVTFTTACPKGVVPQIT